MDKTMLDKSTPIPLYFQLKEIVKEKIDNGELKSGDLIPSEREFKERYDISRPTIRQALKELVNEGLLHREKGKGTFVSKPKINYGFIQKFTTFYDDMEKKGYKTKTKVVNMEVEKARMSLAKKLNIKKDEKVIIIDRVRYIQDEPVVIVKNHIPYNLSPGLKSQKLEDKSLYRLLADKFKIKPYKAEITLEPINADEYDAKALKVDIGAPMHLMGNITYTKENIIMDYFESRFRGDKGKVKVELYNNI